MLRTIKSPAFLWGNCCLSNPIENLLIICPQSNNLAMKPRVLPHSPFRCRKTHLHKPIICAKKSQRKSGFRRLRRVVPKLLAFMASNLKVLPEPLDMVVGELAAGAVGGGGGGRSGIWKGLGGRSFPLWGKTGKMNLGLLLVSGLGLYITLGGELRGESVGILALCLLGAVLIKGFKRGVKDWLLGLCLFGGLLALGLQREDRRKWIQRLRVCSPAFELIKGSIGKRVL